jgi:hypothetical protein
MSKSNTTLTPAERHILDRLGGHRWTIKRFTPAAVKAAKADWKAAYTAVGFTTSALMTTDRTNPKMGKIGLPAMGVTLHSARNALLAWDAAGPQIRFDLAAAVGVPVSAVDNVLRLTVCPMSTYGCRCGCVTAQSANAVLVRSQRSRLARHVFMMFNPASAFTLMAHQLKAARDQHGRSGARWRVNISDDLRLENLAPGLFSVAPRPYSYTKWRPDQRPGRKDVRLVYSASERTSTEQIVKWCKAGHRVAVVMDVPRGAPLPARWAGLVVVDGDATDDLYAHRQGVIVGLRAKGTKQARTTMLDRGFTKPAEVRVQVRPKRPATSPIVPVAGQVAAAA